MKQRKRKRPDRPRPASEPTIRDDPEAMRAFIARIVGWSDRAAVELALASVTLAAAGATTLVLSGRGDMVPIAQALHRRIRPGRPFILVDDRDGRRHGDHAESVRLPASRLAVVPALDAARTGTCCLKPRRRPADIVASMPQLRAAEDVMLMICGGPELADDVLLIRPAPIAVPPLASREHELDRIIAEYAADAIAELDRIIAKHAAEAVVEPDEPPESAADDAEDFTADDHAWVRDYAAGSLGEIEKATLRLAAVRRTGSRHAAANLLGMAQVSLTRWLDRRASLPDYDS